MLEQRKNGKSHRSFSLSLSRLFSFMVAISMGPIRHLHSIVAHLSTFLCVQEKKFQSIKIRHYFIRQTVCPLLLCHCHLNVRCIHFYVWFLFGFCGVGSDVYVPYVSNWISAFELNFFLEGFFDLFFPPLLLQAISRIVVNDVVAMLRVCVFSFIHSFIQPVIHLFFV